MPSKYRKRKPLKVVSNYLGEITVNDFANCSGFRVPNSRMKKGETNAVHKEAEQLKGTNPSNVSKLEHQELSWYEKDLDDFDVNTEETGSGEEEDTESSERDRKAVEFKSRRRKRLPSDSSGVVFPVDLWAHLSRYIQPNDVGRFAALCRYSNAITHTVQFWKQLYHRYNQNVCFLPKSLQPTHLERLHGLRARVIRSLFYLYPPLVDRTKTTVPFENEPHQIVGQRCMLCWYETSKSMWNFCFKFRKERLSNMLLTPSHSLPPNYLVDAYHNVFHNPENDCCVLQVTCHNFIDLPSAMGLVLTKVFLNVSHGMRFHKLKLVFDTHVKRDSSSTSLGTETVVVLDPINNIKVYPWWVPQYPCSPTT